MTVMTGQTAIKILPLGDSITQGNTAMRSYRYELWKKLVDANIQHQFVGSLTTNFTGNPVFPTYKNLNFDNHNEGHFGWKVHELRDNLSNWLKGYTFDIVLFQGGTNDAGTENASQIVSEMKDIVGILRAANPKAIILLGHPFQEWAPFPAIRTGMDQLAAQMNTAQSPVIIVKLETGWVSIRQPQARRQSTGFIPILPEKHYWRLISLQLRNRI